MRSREDRGDRRRAHRRWWWSVGPTADADAQAWATAVQAAGGTVSGAQLDRVSTLIGALKTAGVWTSLDRLWLFAAENSTQALTDLKARAVATAVNSPVFTANRGYAGVAGRTASLGSGFNASTAGGNYARDSASYGVWTETADDDVSQLRVFAGNDATNFGFVGPNVTSMDYAVNSAASGTYTFATQVGMWHAQRTAGSASALFANGVSVSTSGAASVALANLNFNFLAGNNAGAAYKPITGRLAMGFIAGTLAGKELAFYSAMRTYMTAVGVA